MKFLKRILAAELSRSDRMTKFGTKHNDKKLSIRAERQRKKAKEYIFLA